METSETRTYQARRLLGIGAAAVALAIPVAACGSTDYTTRIHDQALTSLKASLTDYYKTHNTAAFEIKSLHVTRIDDAHYKVRVVMRGSKAFDEPTQTLVTNATATVHNGHIKYQLQGVK